MVIRTSSTLIVASYLLMVSCIFHHSICCSVQSINFVSCSYGYFCWRSSRLLLMLDFLPFIQSFCFDQYSMTDGISILYCCFSFWIIAVNLQLMVQLFEYISILIRTHSYNHSYIYFTYFIFHSVRYFNMINVHDGWWATTSQYTCNVLSSDYRITDTLEEMPPSSADLSGFVTGRGWKNYWQIYVRVLYFLSYWWSIVSI